MGTVERWCAEARFRTPRLAVARLWSHPCRAAGAGLGAMAAVGRIFASIWARRPHYQCYCTGEFCIRAEILRGWGRRVRRSGSCANGRPLPRHWLASCCLPSCSLLEPGAAELRVFCWALAFPHGVGRGFGPEGFPCIRKPCMFQLYLHCERQSVQQGQVCREC